MVTFYLLLLAIGGPHAYFQQLLQTVLIGSTLFFMNV